jgi:hypothetical protein
LVAVTRRSLCDGELVDIYQIDGVLEVGVIDYSSHYFT